MVKLLHAADLHLDSAFSALPPEKAAQRRAEQRADDAGAGIYFSVSKGSGHYGYWCRIHDRIPCK